MSITFYTNKVSEESTYYRTMQADRVLQANKIKATVRERFTFYSADKVHVLPPLQNCYVSAYEFDELVLEGKIIITDIDEYCSELSPYQVERSSFFTVSYAQLSDILPRNRQKDVIILSDISDSSLYIEARRVKRDGKGNMIGWIQPPRLFGDAFDKEIDFMASLVQALKKTHLNKVKILLAGEARVIKKIAHKVPGDFCTLIGMVDYKDFALNFGNCDIGLLPRFGDIFVSDRQALQFSFLKIPLIFSRVGDLTRVPGLGVVGFMVEDWIKYIDLLINKGQSNYCTLRSYSLARFHSSEVVKRQWVNFYSRVLA